MTEHRYSNIVDDRNHSWPLQTPEQLKVSLLTPFEFGITDAVMIWGDSDAQDQPPNRRQQLQADLTDNIAPITAAFTKQACACAKASCSGHGRCHSPPPQPPAEALAGPGAGGAARKANVLCFCDDGYSGGDCSTHDGDRVRGVRDTSPSHPLCVSHPSLSHSFLYTKLMSSRGADCGQPCRRRGPRRY